MTNHTMELIELERRVLGDVWTSPALWENVSYLCDECNGRFSGTDDERRAGDFILERFREIGAENVTAEPFEMNGWRRGDAHLALLSTDGQVARDLPCRALPGSPSGRVEAEVVDVGTGTAADFERLGDAIAGKIVLTDEKGPHRLEKYARSHAGGATGFIFARTKPGMLSPTGSLALGKKFAPLPGIGVPLEVAALLRRRVGEQDLVRVRVEVECEQRKVLARNISAEIPGSDPDAGWIVVCAHYDGHDVAQGAQDNAAGTVLVVEVARTLAPLCSHLQAGLRFILFSGEESGLRGSYAYVRDHADGLDHIRAVFNADVVGLAAPLVLSPQNFVELETYLRQLPLEDMGAQVRETKLLPHSDHFPFVLAGVPAISVSSSWPPIGGGWVHTVADTLDKLDQHMLRQTAGTAARILLRMAMNPDGLPKQRQTPAQVQQMMVDAGMEDSLRIQDEWPF